MEALPHEKGESDEAVRVETAAAAFARGDYAQVVRLAESDSEADAVLRVRALANLDASAAATTCERATARHPLSSELHFLHAVILFGSGRTDEAAGAMRRALYLDRTLAIAHFTLGAILRRLGDDAGAARAVRNARDLCAARNADDLIPLADGERAGRLAEVATAELTLLGMNS